MLTRTVPRLDRTRSARAGWPLTQRRLTAWLCAPGSLTARLRAHGQVTVRVLCQGHLPLWPQEQAAIGCRSGHVREVMLMVGGRPAVWARSATPLIATQGAWRAIKGLGTRPLAELLFTHRQVRRGPLQARRLAATSREGARVRRSWCQHTPTSLPGPCPPPEWARHSVFHHKGQPLQVLEAFSPWVGMLLTPRPARSRPTGSPQRPARRRG